MIRLSSPRPFFGQKMAKGANIVANFRTDHQELEFSRCYSPSVKKEMNDATRVLKAIEYIETNLKESLSIGEVANRVGMSFWHFQRLFSAMLKQSVAIYIRNRRAQESIVELRAGKLRVVDIAFEYQFASHEVYTRVFKSLFGVPPSRHRSIHNRIKYPRLTLSPSLRNLNVGGNMKLTPEIQNWEAKKFVGMDIDQDELLNAELPIAKLWDRFRKQDKKIPHKLPNNYGLYTLGNDSTSHATYVAATAVSDFGDLPENYKEFEIEAGPFALFEFNGGVEALPEASLYIYNEWIPNSEY